jgi:hypothetical protein
MEHIMLENGKLWYDTDGNVLHAHGGHILLDKDGYYYWYGEDRRAGIYVSCYRSKDLQTWEFRRHVLTVDSPIQPCRMRTKLELSRDVDDEEYEKFSKIGVNAVIHHRGKNIGKINVERPKVLYCEKTGKYVMWAHYENGKDYSDAAALIATCDTPDGEFVYHGAFNPFGHMSRDCTLFKDEDGTAYFISASRDNLDLHIYRLTPDYMNVAKLVGTPFQAELREAPAVYKKDGKYYMLSSWCTGWAPNQGKWGVADSMEGDWSLLEDFGDETTFASQPAFVLQKDGRDIYVGDRWGGNGDKFFESTYIVLDIQYKDGKPYIEFDEKAAW